MNDRRCRLRGGPSAGRRWHRWLGVVLALPLLWLTGSGLVLRHADALGLHEKRVRSIRLLRHYGLIPEGRARSGSVGGRDVSEWGGILFVDGVVVEDSGRLLGAVHHGGDLVVATPEALLVYGPSGSLVDRLGEASLPGTPLEGVGAGSRGAVVVKVGGEAWEISDDLLSFARARGDVNWSMVTLAGAGEQGELERILGAQAGISVYRLWLDLHSGNLFGGPGKAIVDLSAVGIIVLTLIGAQLVSRKKRVEGGAG